MQPLGANLPFFRSVQLQFADHIRNPKVHERPGDIEPRRMQIYLDLFFNNIQNFVASAFPIAKEIVGEHRWLTLVREFIHLHGSQSPYFLQISEEFLTFLHERGLHDLPGFLLELCHYEWVELSLDVAADREEEQPGQQVNWHREILLNPYTRTLTYSYPVHLIGVEHQPGEPGGQPTFLIVYRNDKDVVRFIESNPVTHRLLELVAELPGAAAITQIHQELEQGGRKISLQQVQDQGMQTLTHLHSQGIIRGTR